MVTIRIPAPSSVLLANLLGLFGLIGVSVAIGGVTHSFWWGLLAGSVFAVTLSVFALTYAAPAAQAAVQQPATASVRAVEDVQVA